MSSPPTVTDYLTAIGALLGGGGALVAGIAACRALNTWRAQLNGQARFDVAKRLLTAAHDLAERFHDARSRVLLEPDLAAALENPQASPSQRATAFGKAFDARWEPVRACGAGMVGLLPEASALLSRDIAEAARALLESTYTLRSMMADYVSMVQDYADQDQDPRVKAEWVRVRRGVYSSDPRRSPEPDNPLTQEFVGRHEALTKLLRPHVERPGLRIG